MSLRLWRFLTLLLAALSVTMESAHVLELPQKMQYDAQMYSAVKQHFVPLLRNHWWPIPTRLHPGGGVLGLSDS